MSYISDVVMRTARKFKISEEEAKKQVASVVEAKITDAAVRYIAGAELNEASVANLMVYRDELNVKVPPAKLPPPKGKSG